MSKFGVAGQYKVELGLEDGGNGDFFSINTYTLDNLRITEKADGSLPTFSINFSCGEDRVASMLHEGATIIIGESLTIGGQEATSKAPFLPLYPVITKQSSNLFNVQASGSLAAPEYQHGANIQIWGLAGAMKVARNILAKHFELHPNSLTSSDDQMNYVQPNISDQMLMRDLLRHAWIRQGQGWPALAITAEGKDGKKVTARLYDMDKEIEKAKAGQTPWKFTNAEEGFQSSIRGTDTSVAAYSKGVPINYNENYVYRNQSPLMNILGGYSRKDLAYDMESQGVETQKALLALKKLTDNPNFVRNMKMAGDTGPSPRFALIGANVHPQYRIAHYTNLGNRALFSSAQVVLTFDGDFYPIRPLDTAYLQVQAIASPNEINPSLTGAYIVDEVTREYANQKTSTTVVLTRDGPQGAQGSLG